MKSSVVLRNPSILNISCTGVVSVNISFFKIPFCPEAKLYVLKVYSLHFSCYSMEGHTLFDSITFCKMLVLRETCKQPKKIITNIIKIIPKIIML